MSALSIATPWLICPQTAQQARLRLLCLPYAGGGASAYRSWQQQLPDTIELCAVQLPGHETRLKEQAYTHLPSLVEAMAEALLPVLDRPFAIFGHSMGALLSFELTRYLRKHAQRSPEHLFLSGCRAAHLPLTEPDVHTLSDEGLIDYLRRFNGTPEEILQNEEMMQLLLPIFRADFTLYETYQYQHEEPLSCPITVFGGHQDSSVSYQQLQAWRDHTRGAFAAHMLPGNHFFLQPSRDQLLALIKQALNQNQ
uniref:Thioesterase n=1 Tax=Thermosporothrix sp. COM3 TaxID=2490863 RepID=A0A455SQ06_9CHLR|nr:thioesterase [Thermosporothrix sp. COM3]